MLVFIYFFVPISEKNCAPQFEIAPLLIAQHNKNKLVKKKIKNEC